MTTCADQTNFDPLKNAVLDITNAMRIDFAEAFWKAFPTEEDVRLLRRRLYSRARNLPIQAVIDGYEASLGDGKMPSVENIIAHANQIASRIRKTERERLEAERVAALPPPNREGLERIASERLEANRKAVKQESPEERSARRAEMLRQHEALIAAARAAGRIYTPKFAGKQCAIPYCENAGTISSSTTGSELWYCKTHFRR